MVSPVRVAIMQPYFLPYIGYWQLINSVDKFVVYDNVQFTKKGWINRNRFLQSGKGELFSLPLKKDSDYLNICDRYLSDAFLRESKKTLRKFESAYRKAPNYSEGFELFKRCLLYEEKNLFRYISNSIEQVCSYLNIETEIIISSSLAAGPDLKKENRVIAICQEIGATDYINPIGGQTLYNKEDFDSNELNLHFQQVRPYRYQQFDFDFIPHLSVMDIIMFNDRATVKNLLYEMDLV